MYLEPRDYHIVFAVALSSAILLSIGGDSAWPKWLGIAFLVFIPVLGNKLKERKRNSSNQIGGHLYFHIISLALLVGGALFIAFKPLANEASNYIGVALIIVGGGLATLGKVNA